MTLNEVSQNLMEMSFPPPPLSDWSPFAALIVFDNIYKFKYSREFMTLNEVPQNLMERVTDYIVSKWTNTKGVEQDKVLSICPKE